MMNLTIRHKNISCSSENIEVKLLRMVKIIKNTL